LFVVYTKAGLRSNPMGLFSSGFSLCNNLVL
jgi:hypothetical protein